MRTSLHRVARRGPATQACCGLLQGVHAPAQVPQSYIEPYAASIADGKRRTFAGMLSAVDEGIKNVTDALAAAGALENTIIVFTAVR